EPSLTEQMVGGGAYYRNGAIAIPPPRPLTRQVHVDNRYIAPLLSPAQEYFADLGQQRLSAVTLAGSPAVHQRKTQRHPGDGQSEIVTGSFGNPQGTLDLAHRGIVGPQHAKGYPRTVGEGDGRGVGHWVGAAGHGQAVPQVIAPSTTTQTETGNSPRRIGEC